MINKILSISIASYNAEKDLPRCLESFIGTNVLEKLDIIVVNDGSKDSTLSVAKEYEKKFPYSITVIDKKNGGHGSTINSGIINARGKYFKIVDSDDWIDSVGLEKLVQFLEKTDVDIVFNPFYKVNYSDINKKTIFDPFFQKIIENKEYKIEELSGTEQLHMHAMTFKTDIVKKVGPIIDERCFYVDMEYCIYPLVYAKTVCYQNYPVYEYLLGSANQSVSISSMIKRRNEHLTVIKSLLNYYSRFNRLLSNSTNQIIYKRINESIMMQIAIYLLMKSKIGRVEMISFLNFLKEMNFEVIFNNQHIVKKTFWNLFKYTKFKFYSLFSLLYCLGK